MASDLKRRLEEAASPEPRNSSAAAAGGGCWRAGWRWVPRANRAAAHPTDFALVELPSGAAPAVFEAVLRRRLGGALRDVHPDRRLSGRLKGVEAEGGGGAEGVPAGAADAAQRQQSQPQGQEQQQQQEQQDEWQQQQQEEEQQQQQEQQQEQRPSRWQQWRRRLFGGPPPAPALGGAGGAPRRGGVLSVSKGPGRLQTRPTLGLDPSDPTQREGGGGELRRRRRARALRAGGGVAAMLGAEELWALGYTGGGIKVGVFDTGIRQDHPHLRRIRDRTNWTHQDSLADGLGHGTFVAGVIGGADAACPGLAPDIELHTFKVFTDDQVSYTSWFLDAFNYAMEGGVHVINLSIGGPDYLDAPFVDKAKEVTASGILMVSAIGNDGPLYGTLNNPADQSDVIGVGGISNGGSIASFSSRGMTTHELPVGTGRVKPDVMAYAKDVSGSKMQGGCRQLSGTSVASPVVAGCVALLASTVPPATRWPRLNPASMKQALVEGADRLPNLNIFEQGAGRVNLQGSMAVLERYAPRASLVPPRLDFTDCPYMWPHCKQPVYAFGLPLAFNATVLNGMDASGAFAGAPEFEPADEGGKLLEVSFTHSDVLWPWSGFLGVFVEVSPAAWNFSGVASGDVVFTIESPAPWGGGAPRRSTVRVPLRVQIVPTPPRGKRVLWDQFHSVRYPPGYIPRDNLDIKSDILDWHGDHLFTNYHELYDDLVKAGYFVEVLSTPVDCVDLRNYGAYLVVDSEEEWYPGEVAAVEAAVKEGGLQLIVFAEWYHAESLAVMKFFDDNTRSWWTPATGGANVPALNELLAPHGVALGDAIVQGAATIAGLSATVSYGTSIARFPAGGALHTASLTDVATRDPDAQEPAGKRDLVKGQHAVLGVTRSAAGGVAVFGDSNCLDSSHRVSNCHPLLLALLEELAGGGDRGLTAALAVQEAPYSAPQFPDLPHRREGVDFAQYSFVLSNPPRCYAAAPRGARGCGGAAGRGALARAPPPAAAPAAGACPARRAELEGLTWLEPGKQPKPYSGGGTESGDPREAGRGGGAAGARAGAGPPAPGGGGAPEEAPRRETAAHAPSGAAAGGAGAEAGGESEAAQPPPAGAGGGGDGGWPAAPTPLPWRPPHGDGHQHGAGAGGGGAPSAGGPLLQSAPAAAAAICGAGLLALAAVWRRRRGGGGGGPPGAGGRARYSALRRGAGAPPPGEFL
ncbi:MAG: hypothetical protein J3K34DRAFT_509177 [Monoraphidium minutum]|nr:MAG: hypothetical protein J3K34DRAFT_509177 [Monoraphidium minutum]